MGTVCPDFKENINYDVEELSQNRLAEFSC